MSLIKGIFYVIVQSVGAIAGAAVLRVCFSFTSFGKFIMYHKIFFFGFLQITIPQTLGGVNLGVSVKASALTEGQAVVVEAFITFLLIVVIKAVNDPKRQDIKSSAPLAVGLAVVAGHLCAVS